MAHVDNLRRHFSLVRHLTYLDTGTFGALPDVTVSAMKAKLDTLYEEGRTGGRLDVDFAQTRDSVRELLARLLSVTPDALALMESRTQAIFTILNGLQVGRNDEVVRIGYEGDMTTSIANLSQMTGAVVRVVSDGLPEDEMLKVLEACLNQRTRLVTCSHLSSTTGGVLPVGKIAELAKRAGAFILVDGSDAVGAFDVHVENSDIDFYTFSCERWLLGPGGTACLYVAPHLLSVVKPSIVSISSLRFSAAYGDTSCLFHESARKYEATLTDTIAWTGLYESLRFLLVTAGWEYTFTRIHGLSGALMDQLFDIPGVRVMTPRDSRAGRIHIAFKDKHISGIIVREGLERSILVNVTPMGSVAVSVGIYNSEEDVTRFAQFLRTTLERV